MKTCATIALASLLGLGRAEELPRSTPEAQGVRSAAILDFVQTANEKLRSLHSFMLVRHGAVVAECWWAPYEAQSPHALYSLTKSFTSTAVGLAISDGKLSLDDQVLKFFPDEAPASPATNLKAMRIRDLLRMSTGQETEPLRPPDRSWIKAFLEHPVPFKPGTHFLYNTSASCMLAAIVEKSVGMSLSDYLGPRLFTPLGIAAPDWEKSPQGINIGGYGLSLRTEDIARFGLLYLHQGSWQGKQVVPRTWVEAATSLQTSNGSNPLSDWDQGYGYQFWRCRYGCFRGDGAFGQFCLVMPQQDAVVAITSGISDMQSVLSLVWEKLLPAMSATALPPDAATHEQLARVVEHLSLPVPHGTAAAAPKLLGKTYVFTQNALTLETLALQESDPGLTTLIARFNGQQTRIECAHGTWKKQRAAWMAKVQPIAASGAWTAADTFTASICPNETPFVYKVTLTFSGNAVHYHSEANVGFGSTKSEDLAGTFDDRPAGP